MKTKFILFTISLLLFMLISCTLAPLECFLNFSDFNKTYEFNFSKDELKNRIIEVYSYDVSLLKKNLGKTIIENEDVNKNYRKSVDMWLDKNNWNKFKSEIRQNTSDTLNILITKHQSRKQIQLVAIIRGDNQKSSLTINGFKYEQRNSCNENKDYYTLTLTEKIQKKFINKLE